MRPGLMFLGEKSMSNDQSNQPSKQHHDPTPEEPRSVEPLAEQNESVEPTQEVPTRNRGADALANVVIVTVAFVATIIFGVTHMVPHGGATRSDVFEQENRQAELRRALAEQEDYLRGVSVELPNDQAQETVSSRTP